MGLEDGGASKMRGWVGRPGRYGKNNILLAGGARGPRRYEVKNLFI